MNFTNIPTGGGQELGIVGAQFATSVAEPGSVALLGGGALLLGILLRRSRRGTKA